MAIKSNMNVEVGDTETELIGSTATDSHEARTFSIGNKEKEVEVKAWGSPDNMAWQEITSKTIAPEGYDTIILGVNHWWYVKLTGKTTNPGDTTHVDVYFTYTPSS
jgi:hypothetical protein